MTDIAPTEIRTPLDIVAEPDPQPAEQDEEDDK
jgi:hypothetical protein